MSGVSTPRTLGRFADILLVRPGCHSVIVLVFESLCFYLIMAPKHQRSDTGIWDTPLRSCGALLFSEKAKLLNLIREKKSHMLRWLGSVSICEIVKKELEMRAGVAIPPQTAKLPTTWRGKCLAKREENEQKANFH